MPISYLLKSIRGQTLYLDGSIFNNSMTWFPKSSQLYTILLASALSFQITTVNKLLLPYLTLLT